MAAMLRDDADAASGLTSGVSINNSSSGSRRFERGSRWSLSLTTVIEDP